MLCRALPRRAAAFALCVQVVYTQRVSLIEQHVAQYHAPILLLHHGDEIWCLLHQQLDPTELIFQEGLAVAVAGLYDDLDHFRRPFRLQDSDLLDKDAIVEQLQVLAVVAADLQHSCVRGQVLRQVNLDRGKKVSDHVALVDTARWPQRSAPRSFQSPRSLEFSYCPVIFRTRMQLPPWFLRSLVSYAAHAKMHPHATTTPRLRTAHPRRCGLLSMCACCWRTPSLGAGDST